MRSVLNSDVPPLDAVDGIALREEELGEIGAILAGDAGDECSLVHE